MDNRRKTVNVTCSVPNGIVMQLHGLPETGPDNPSPLPEAQIGDRVTLKSGGNPGIDKAFFEFWKTENKNLSVIANGMITATDEEAPETAEVERETEATKSADERQENDHGS